MQYLILGMPVVGIDVARHVETVRREIDGVPGHPLQPAGHALLPDGGTLNGDLRHPQFHRAETLSDVFGDR